jgi:hypothetical protein
MKRSLGLTILLAGLISVAYAATVLQTFTARPDADRVVVEWQTGTEQGLVRFDIERASRGSDKFEVVGTKNSQGSYTFYQFDDTNVMGKSAADNTYQYRLHMINTDGSTAYSKVINVSQGFSSVKRTWGQIKEMFR